MQRTGVIAALAALVLAMPATASAMPERNQAVAKPKPFVNVMPLGDSITWGYQIKSGKAVVIDGYRRDLWVRLRKVGMNVNFVGSCPRPKWDKWKCNGKGTMGDNNHEGHSGYRIDQLSANVPAWMNKYKPRIVLLMAGTNDIAQRYDLNNAPARMSKLIDRIRAARPSAHIFVATIPQYRDPANKARVKAYNDGVVKVVRSKGKLVHLVPQHIVGTERKDFSDHVHPSDCGYAKLSFVWYNTLERDLAPNKWPTGYWPWSNTGVCA